MNSVELIMAGLAAQRDGEKQPPPAPIPMPAPTPATPLRPAAAATPTPLELIKLGSAGGDVQTTPAPFVVRHGAGGAELIAAGLAQARGAEVNYAPAPQVAGVKATFEDLRQHEIREQMSPRDWITKGLGGQ